MYVFYSSELTFSKAHNRIKASVNVAVLINFVLSTLSAMSSMIRNQEKRIQKVKDQEKMLLK